MLKSLRAADLFCGAGGTSTGLARACKKRGLKLDLLAINHWDLAIDTHTTNHPYARHMCASLDHVNPREVVPSGRLHLLVASPECTHHSVARGGRPINEQSRATAWHVIKWAQELYIENILIENVREFQTWGPLKTDGTPDKRYKGQMFKQFIECLKSLGYKVDWKVLCAADYGDATTRERLFIQCRKKGEITWPQPTHVRPVELKRDGDLFSAPKKPWRSAREIIDWNMPGKSIFGRSKPLSPKTLKRIATGLKKFNGEAATPFLLMLYGTGMVRDIGLPLPTITGSGQHVALCDPKVKPFVMAIDNGSTEGASATDIEEPISTVVTKQRHCVVEPVANVAEDVIPVGEQFILPQFGGGSPRSVDEPLRTVTTTSRGIGLCEPVVIAMEHHGANGLQARPVSEPMQTISAHGRFAVAEPVAEKVDPFLVHSGGPEVAERSIDDPLNTVLTREHMAVVEPVLTKLDPFMVNVGGPEGSARQPKSVDEPMGTVMTENHTAVVEPTLEPFVMAINHGNDGPTSDERRCYDVSEPLKTLTTEKSFAVVNPFLTAVNHGETGKTDNRNYPVDEPLGTLTTKGSYALVEGEAAKVDSAFLMKYYGSGISKSVDEPLDTISTKDRFGLVMINGEPYRLDIRLRMLEPKELAAAHSMDHYLFKGGRSMQVKQIGNGVPAGMAEALCSEILSQYADVVVNDEAAPLDLVAAAATQQQVLHA